MLDFLRMVPVFECLSVFVNSILPMHMLLPIEFIGCACVGGVRDFNDTHVRRISCAIRKHYVTVYTAELRWSAALFCNLILIAKGGNTSDLCPELRRNDLLNLSISVSRGKETKKDSRSNGE